MSRRLSGIEEHLLRWGWYLPEGYEPSSLQDCRKCHELVLVVIGAGVTIKLNRDGAPHTLHPVSTSLPVSPDATIEDLSVLSSPLMPQTLDFDPDNKSRDRKR